MGGMDKDTAKPKYPNNKYPDSQNVRPVTDKGLSTGALENIKGTEEIFEMLEIKGMLVIEAVSPTLVGSSQNFKLTALVSPGMDISDTIDFDDGKPSDILFDVIEELLQDNIYNYVRLQDEDRIVIYFPTSSPRQPVLFNNAIKGEDDNLKWEIYPTISDFRIIGHTPLRDNTILFTVNDNGELGWNQTPPFSQIWSMSYDPANPKTTAKVDLLYNGQLGFNREHPIEAIARYENTETQRVYFTDNFNVPRTFNAVRDDTWALRINDFSLITENELSMPLVTTEDQDGGSLPTGRWYVTYRLKKFGGSTSALAPFSAGTAVTTSKVDTSLTDPKYWDYAYATTIVNSTKMLNYQIPFIPIGFDEISIYVVHEPEPENFKAFLFKTDTLTSEDSYEFTLSTILDLEEIPIEDLKQYDIDFERVKTLTAKHNRLLFGNVKEAVFNIEYDARAYRFDENTSNTYVTIDTGVPKTWEVPLDSDAINGMNKDSDAATLLSNSNDYRYKRNTNILGGSGPNVEYEFTFKEITLDDSSHVEPSNSEKSSPNELGNPLWPEKSPFVNVPAEDEIEVNINEGTSTNTIDIGPGFANFKNGRLEAYFKGYMRDEVYRFGIVFYSDTGRASDVKWIGDIRMPCAGDFSPSSDGVWKGALAQWYSDTLTQPVTANAKIPKGEGETKGWMLGLKFSVDLSNYINPDGSGIRGDISGFSIVRAPRKQKDKTIIAEGALGEVASKPTHSGTPATDILYKEFSTSAPFSAQKTKYSSDEGVSFDSLPNAERSSPDFISLMTPPSPSLTHNIYLDGPSATNYLIRCETIKTGGGSYNNGGGLSTDTTDPFNASTYYPGSGWYFEAPETNIYTFDASIRVGAELEFIKSWGQGDPPVVDPGGANLTPPASYSQLLNDYGFDCKIEFVTRLRVTKKTGQETTYQTKYLLQTRYPNGSINNSWKYGIPVFEDLFLAGSTELNPAIIFEVQYTTNQDHNINSSTKTSRLSLNIGDKVVFESFAIMTIKSWGIQSLFPDSGYTDTKYLRILNRFKIEAGTPDFATQFSCTGIGEGVSKRRLFNYTRVIDGNTYISPDGDIVNRGYPKHKHTVFDDWTLSTSSNLPGGSDIASDYYTNVGEFATQYATLDCPDLKFVTGTKIQNYLADNEEDIKYTLKPVAGYVHISEEDPIARMYPKNSNSIVYDETTAVASTANFSDGIAGYSQIGYIDSEDPISENNSNSQQFIKFFSRYTKALALVHGVSFGDRLSFNTDGYGKVKELKKVENKGYVDVNTGKDPDEELRFLNVGFCTNTHNLINIPQSGSALISPGVFTAFMAGNFVDMTKYLINYAFGYKATKDKDPYIGQGHLRWTNPDNGGTSEGNILQHNEYHDIPNANEGNKIGFYNTDGSGTKMPRRGQVTIVDIYRELDSQYGGSTFKERKDTEYISIGHFSRVNKDTPNIIDVDVFGGDIHQSAFAEKKLYSANFTFQEYIYSGDDEILGAPKLAYSPIVGRIYPVQSVVNADMRVGYHFNNYKNYPDVTIPADDPNASTVELIYEQEGDDYFCPVLYSLEEKLQTYLVTGQNLLTGEFDNRIYASQTKINGELFDSWTTFKPLDYMDVDGHYGPINKLEIFNDQVMFFQDKAFGLVSLNPQSIITDISGGEVQLGTGRGLVAFRYISNSVGAFHQWGIVKAKGAMYFFDAYHRKFFRYAKGAEPLSDLKGMSSWIYNNIVGEVLTSDNPILFQGITSVYDQRFSEVIFTFHVEIEEEKVPLPPSAEEGAVTLTGEEASIAEEGLVGNTPCASIPGIYGLQTLGAAGGWIPVDYTNNPESFIENEINAGGSLEIDFSSCTPGYKNLDCYKLGKRPARVIGSTANRPLIIGFNCPTGQSAMMMGIGLGGYQSQEGDKVWLKVWCAPVEVGPTIPEVTPAIKILPKTSYTLVYNEMIDAFTSFYSHFPRHYISDSKRIFSQPPEGYPVYMHDAGVRGEFYNETFNSIIELLVNPKGTWTKVFNNIEYLTQASNTAGSDLLNVTFDTLRVLNEYQDSGDITLVVDENVRRRMRTWRTQVPRDGKARIRNPYVTMKFTYENNANNRRLIIHDILTHYMDAPM